MIIACADSRADPATIFSAAPGSCSWCATLLRWYRPSRRVGAITEPRPPLSLPSASWSSPRSSSWVMACAEGIAAALSERSTGRFIGPWVELLAGIRAQLADATQPPDAAARQKDSEQLAIQYSLQNLTSFPLSQRPSRLVGCTFTAPGSLSPKASLSGLTAPAGGSNPSVRSFCPQLTSCASGLRPVAPHAPQHYSSASGRLGLLPGLLPIDSAFFLAREQPC